MRGQRIEKSQSGKRKGFHALRFPLYAICYLLFAIHCLSALEVGTPSGKVGKFATFEKHFYGDYIDASDWNSSEIMNIGVLADGTTSHYTDQFLVPGNTYYYWFKSQSVSEQKTPNYRTIFISSTTPGYVIVDGVIHSTTSLITSATIWHNWANAPPAPANLTSFWADDNTYISLSWDNPQFSGTSVLDLVYGGGYEIYRSTISFTEGLIFLSSLTALSSVMNFTDTNVTAGTTYYYAVRSYDAYIPPLYSSFAQTLPVSKRNYLTVNFILDVSNLSEVKSVQIVGDFTVPQGYRGRLPLSNLGDGRWEIAVRDFTLYSGAVIKYKYMINDEIYEDDIPLALGGPYRTVVLKDEGGSKMTIFDVWSVWTPTATPSNLPENVVGFSAEPSDNIVKISWDFDPFSTNTILGFKLWRSTSTPADDTQFTLLYSTAQLLPDINFATDTVLNGTTAYYKISSVSKTGAESKLSDYVKVIPPNFGTSIPSYNVAKEDMFVASDFSAEFGNKTGEITLRWYAAKSDSNYGNASNYVIRYATFPITDANKFKRAKLAGIVKGLPSGGKANFATVNLGENCPSYYFAVCAVYGLWHKVGFSTYTLAVAPQRIDIQSASKVLKTSRLPGGNTSQIVAAVELPQGALPKGEYLVVIKNYFDLQNDNKYKFKINEANKLSRSDERFGYLIENEDSGLSSVFGFELYDNSRSNVFDDKNSDGFPDRLAKKDITVALSYEGLNVPPEELKVAVLNEKNNFWRILKDIKPEIDRENKLLKFKSRHFSVYALFKSGKAATDLSDVVVYPNPFKPYDNKSETGDYSSGIRFINLTKNAKIWIYNIAGELVRKDLFSDEQGECKWDVKNDAGEYVSSGVYVFVVKDETLTSGKNKFIGKLGVIR